MNSKGTEDLSKKKLVNNTKSMTKEVIDLPKVPKTPFRMNIESQKMSIVDQRRSTPSIV